MAGGVTVTFNGAALKSIAVQGAQADLRVRANRVVNAARRLAPVDTGRLRASITQEFSTGYGGAPVVRIGSNLPYAIFVHQGTGIYGPKGQRIFPKHGKFMVWPAINNSGSGSRRYKGGRTAMYVFARSTRGMPGRPFLVQALDAAKSV